MKEIEIVFTEYLFKNGFWGIILTILMVIIVVIITAILIKKELKGR